MEDLKLGLIGYPVKHSLSPWIHEQFLEQAGMKGSYKLYEINPAAFDKEIKQLLQSGINGFNITVPYKQKIIPYLDELDSDAEKIGAVNTAVYTDGKWKGYNTDGSGYLRSLETAFPELMGGDPEILLLGAGGGARGIYRALSAAGFSRIDIANRTRKKAENLLEVKEPATKTSLLSYEEAAKELGDYKLIIQTTSVGMKPNINDQVISADRLAPGAAVSDIVYQPIQTAFLKAAKAKGAAIHHGHAMLLYQAQYAFRIWSGKDVQTGSMLERLEHTLTED